MAGFVKEDTSSPRLVTSREPVGPDSEQGKTAGSQAVMDALLIIGGAWAVLLFLYFSLRRYNV